MAARQVAARKPPRGGALRPQTKASQPQRGWKGLADPHKATAVRQPTKAGAFRPLAQRLSLLDAHTAEDSIFSAFSYQELDPEIANAPDKATRLKPINQKWRQVIRALETNPTSPRVLLSDWFADMTKGSRRSPFCSVLAECEGLRRWRQPCCGGRAGCRPRPHRPARRPKRPAQAPGTRPGRTRCQ